MIKIIHCVFKLNFKLANVLALVKTNLSDGQTLGKKRDNFQQQINVYFDALRTRLIYLVLNYASIKYSYDFHILSLFYEHILG